MVEGGDAGRCHALVVEPVPVSVGAAYVGDEVSAFHGTGVVDGAAETVLSRGAGVFEEGGQVQDLGDEDFVVAFAVEAALFGSLEARDADEEDFGDVVEAKPDSSRLALFVVEILALLAGQVEFIC